MRQVNKVLVLFGLVGLSCHGYSQTLVSVDLLDTFNRSEVSLCIEEAKVDSTSTFNSTRNDFYQVLNFPSHTPITGELTLERQGAFYHTYLKNAHIDDYEVFVSSSGGTYCVKLLIGGAPVFQNIVTFYGMDRDTVHSIMVLDSNDRVATFSSDRENSLREINLELRNGSVELFFYPNGSPSVCNIYVEDRCVQSTLFYKSGYPKRMLSGQIRNSIEVQASSREYMARDLSKDFTNIDTRLIKGRYFVFGPSGKILSERSW